MKQTEINVEKPTSEEHKRMKPISTISTDTNVLKQFLISIENEQVEFCLLMTDFEGRTLEQYATPLI